MSYTSQDTLSEAIYQWRECNDNGEGYPVGNLTDDPHDAAKREGWRILGMTEWGAVLCRRQPRGLTMIADANGPWAVDLATCDDCDTLLSAKEHDTAQWCNGCAEGHAEEQ